MPTGPRLLIKNACYHITIRGNQKQQVFFDEKDFKRYLLTLRKFKRKFSFLLYGYCLMPNHIHLIGEPKLSTNMAKFMQGLSRAYTAYFNKRYKKVGHLWQGRFKSKVIIKDNYLIDCIHYVEFNPVRAKIVNSAGEYRWSSYQERVLGKSSFIRLLGQLQL